MYFFSLVTSQNVTAPKQLRRLPILTSCLVTSQNVTAPKPALRQPCPAVGLVTSQNVTAPKQLKHSLALNRV